MGVKGCQEQENKIKKKSACLWAFRVLSIVIASVSSVGLIRILFFFLAYNFRVVLLSHLLLPKITCFFFPTTQNKLQFQNSFEPFFIQKLISFYFFSE